MLGGKVVKKEKNTSMAAPMGAREGGGKHLEDPLLPLGGLKKSLQGREKELHGLYGCVIFPSKKGGKRKYAHGETLKEMKRVISCGYEGR